MNMETKIKNVISQIFGEYDMRNAENTMRMERVFEYCMSDLEAHPLLNQTLQTQDDLEFFVMQSILYCI